MTACLRNTTDLTIASNVTNPVTRHATVHAAAVRTLARAAPGRVVFGIGRGDSAVRTHGLRAGSTAQLAATVAVMRSAAAECEVPPPIFVAAAGPRTAELAGACADGVIAGAGADVRAIARVAKWSGHELGDPSFPVWAPIRLGVANTEEDVEALRRRFVARALSAARFNLGRWFDGKDVPPEFEPELRAAFDRYDFAYHGVAAENPNQHLLASRPDIEAWLVDRFVIVGNPTDTMARLEQLHAAGCAGVFCSILFEDPVSTVKRLSEAICLHSSTDNGVPSP
jgi:alkanesulfonate monooxygenase SsuD/methylene tetrahydromethanopterin reductase-like flavin-dependent oxidoreductase (luciferase family)